MCDASLIANSDLPDAVGPASKITFFFAPFEAYNVKFILVLQLYKISGCLNCKLLSKEFLHLDLEFLESE